MDFRLYCKHCGKLTGGGGKQLGISHKECIQHTKKPHKTSKKLNKSQVDYLIKYAESRE